MRSGAVGAPGAGPQQTRGETLTLTENAPTAPELEHAESGAPAPEQLEQAVEELGGAPVAPDAPLFSDFDVHPDVVAALAEVGITRTFAIQELTLPLALAGNDLIGQARTGTGKTLGFGVPMLQRVTPPAEGGEGAGDPGLGQRGHDVGVYVEVAEQRAVGRYGGAAEGLDGLLELLGVGGAGLGVLLLDGGEIGGGRVVLGGGQRSRLWSAGGTGPGGG